MAIYSADTIEIRIDGQRVFVDDREVGIVALPAIYDGVYELRGVDRVRDAFEGAREKIREIGERMRDLLPPIWQDKETFDAERIAHFVAESAARAALLGSEQRAIFRANRQRRTGRPVADRPHARRTCAQSSRYMVAR